MRNSFAAEGRRVEPHTHTKRHAGNFFMVMASGMARRRVRRTYVRTSHFMTFLHEAIFAGRAETKGTLEKLKIYICVNNM